MMDDGTNLEHWNMLLSAVGRGYLEVARHLLAVGITSENDLSVDNQSKVPVLHMAARLATSEWFGPWINSSASCRGKPALRNCWIVEKYTTSITWIVYINTSTMILNHRPEQASERRTPFQKQPYKKPE